MNFCGLFLALFVYPFCYLFTLLGTYFRQILHNFCHSFCKVQYQSLPRFPRTTPGKSRKNCWTLLTESQNTNNSRISGTGKGKPAANLGPTLPGPCAHLPCGVFFLTWTVPAFSSFSERRSAWEGRGAECNKIAHRHSLRNCVSTRARKYLGVYLWKPFLGILGSHLVAISVY